MKLLCMKESEEELVIYANGIIYCSICTNIKNKARIELLVNQMNPTGIESKWQISKNKTFACGGSNPSPCNKKLDTHTHYLMEC